MLAIAMTAILGAVPNLAWAFNYTPQSVHDLSMAYGYVAGQGRTLNRIRAELPSLGIQAQLVESQFNAAFPNIEQKLEMHLEAAVPPGLWPAAKEELLADVRELLDGQEMNVPLAKQFLDEVSRRAQGHVPSPVIETLLTVQYESTPSAEFLDGFRQGFSTDGSGKARGVRLDLELPRSWAAASGKRPHIVQKWTSENGRGFMSMLLDVRETEPYLPSREELQSEIQPESIRMWLPDGWELLDAGLISIELADGIWYDATADVRRGDVALRQFTRMYQIFLGDRAVGLMCIAAEIPGEEETGRKAFERLRPLCQLVFNSLVLPDQY